MHDLNVHPRFACCQSTLWSIVWLRHGLLDIRLVSNLVHRFAIDRAVVGYRQYLHWLCELVLGFDPYILLHQRKRIRSIAENLF